MTKEELVKEAKERAEKLEGSQTLGVYDNDDLTYDEGYNKGQVAGYEEGYLAGAEPREKRIAELEAQIKKMKCCSNCSIINTRTMRDIVPVWKMENVTERIIEVVKYLILRNGN